MKIGAVPVAESGLFSPPHFDLFNTVSVNLERTPHPILELLTMISGCPLEGDDSSDIDFARVTAD
jgi:hypothetical protein